MRLLSLCLMLLAFAFPATAAPSSPEAFSDWFIKQDFEGQEYYQWAAILNALTDGIDRSRDPRLEIQTPVSVAILTGSKFHDSSSCAGLRNASRILTLDLVEAVERGFTPCSECNTSLDVSVVDSDAVLSYWEVAEEYLANTGIYVSTWLSRDLFFGFANSYDFDDVYFKDQTSLEDALLGTEPESYLHCSYSPSTSTFDFLSHYYTAPLESVFVRTDSGSFSPAFYDTSYPSIASHHVVFSFDQLYDVLNSSSTVFEFVTNQGTETIDVNLETAPLLYMTALLLYDCALYSDMLSPYYLNSDMLDNMKASIKK